MSVITYKRGDKTALTKNFSRYEFDCPCGCGTQMVDPELAEKLQRIRDVVGKKIKITSGYRCLKRNQDAGGGTNSRHRYGMAADWRLEDRSLNPVALGILASAVGFGGIGIYWYAGNMFCHADTRGTKATWHLRVVSDSHNLEMPIRAGQRRRGCAMQKSTTRPRPT